MDRPLDKTEIFKKSIRTHISAGSELLEHKTPEAGYTSGIMVGQVAILNLLYGIYQELRWMNNVSESVCGEEGRTT